MWSYGCVLYEIWSIGHIPFEELTGSAVSIICINVLLYLRTTVFIIIQAVQQISRGYRLPPPPGCPKAIYQLMINCWLVIITPVI